MLLYSIHGAPSHSRGRGRGAWHVCSACLVLHNLTVERFELRTPANSSRRAWAAQVRNRRLERKERDDHAGGKPDDEELSAKHISRHDRGDVVLDYCWL